MMKQYSIYIIPFVTAIIGFTIAWFIRPDSIANQYPQTQEIHQDKNNQIWTCSMHPQIQQNEPGSCPLCGMDLIPLSNMSSSNDPFVLQMTQQAVKLANVQTSVVGSSKVNSSQIKINGRVKPNETLSANIVAHIPGRIEQLFISYTGEKIVKGQKIASIYSPDLIAAQKELIEAQKIKEISPALFSAAKNKLKLWKINKNTIQNIINSQTIQEQFPLFADYSGVVMKKKVSVGDHLNAGSVLFEVQDLDQLWVLFEIYEEDLSKVKLGSFVKFKTTAVSNKTFTAKISFIDPLINSQTRVATVRAVINNFSHILKPEMFVTGELRQFVSRKQTQVLVPKTAVIWTGEKSVVYVKEQDTEIPSFQFRKIEIGPAVGNQYQVKSGLSNGEEVVTNGAFVIDASAQLNNQTSAMNNHITIKGFEKKIIKFKKTSKYFKNEIQLIVEQYFKLKDALVLTKDQIASKESSLLDKLITKVKTDVLNKKELDYWNKNQKLLSAHNLKIKNSKDIEFQRQQFDFVSQLLIEIVQVFNIPNDHYYVLHCPMAINDKGADWLSNEAVVRNPFFGDKMMSCGVIKDSLFVE